MYAMSYIDSIAETSKYMYLLENTRYALAIIGSPCNKLPYQGSLGISRATQA